MKVLNVFAIIFAWILSIAMVVMLVAAPVALSALSVLDPETIAEAVGEGLVKTDEPAAAVPQKDYSFEKLSVDRDTLNSVLGEVGERVPADNVMGGLMDSIQGIVGEEMNEEVLNNILKSDLTEDLLKAYVGDIANVITGKTDKNQFTAEKIAEVVEDNLDEILKVVEESGQKLTDDQKEQLKGEIQKVVKENAQGIAQEIVDAVPTPEEILETNEDVKAFLAFMAKREQIKRMIVGAIVLVSVLIFALRYPGFRGLRWLSTNLFTAGGFNIAICLILGIGSSAIIGLAEGLNAIDLISVDSIVGELLSQFTMGVIIRTVIIFVAAIVLLVAYILLKMFVRKKKTQKAVPVMKEPVAAPAPAVEPVPASTYEDLPAGRVAWPSAPEYTSVTIEPELMTDPAPEKAQESSPVAEECGENVIEEASAEDEI